MKIKTVGKATALALPVAFLASCGGNDSDGGQQYLAYGGATQGGAAYQISVGYSEILNREVDNLQVDVEVTGGGADNVQLLSDGQIDIGHGNSGVGYSAYHGEGDWEGEPLENIAGWLPLYEYPFQVIVSEQSDIESVSDLEGADIGVNVQGSGGEVTSNEVFTSLGLEREEDYTPHYLDYEEAAEALSLGQIDATVFSTGAPTPQLVELQATEDVRILEFTEEELNTVDEDYEWLTTGEIAAGTYEGMDDAIPTVHAATINYISADLSDDLVYEMTTAIWENREELTNTHATQENLDEGLVESATLPILPLHPGAERFFEEEGLL